MTSTNNNNIRSLTKAAVLSPRWIQGWQAILFVHPNICERGERNAIAGDSDEQKKYAILDPSLTRTFTHHTADITVRRPF